MDDLAHGYRGHSRGMRHYLAALVQSGILGPDLTCWARIAPLTPSTSAVPATSNQWSMWTSLGVEIASGKPSLILPDRSVITIGRVYRGAPQPFTNRPGHPAVLPFSVGSRQAVDCNYRPKGPEECDPVNPNVQFQQISQRN